MPRLPEPPPERTADLQYVADPQRPDVRPGTGVGGGTGDPVGSPRPSGRPWTLHRHAPHHQLTHAQRPRPGHCAHPPNHMNLVHMRDPGWYPTSPPPVHPSPHPGSVRRARVAVRRAGRVRHPAFACRRGPVRRPGAAGHPPSVRRGRRPPAGRRAAAGVSPRWALLCWGDLHGRSLVRGPSSRAVCHQPGRWTPRSGTPDFPPVENPTRSVPRRPRRHDLLRDPHPRPRRRTTEETPRYQADRRKPTHDATPGRGQATCVSGRESATEALARTPTAPAAGRAAWIADVVRRFPRAEFVA